MIAAAAAVPDFIKDLISYFNFKFFPTAFCPKEQSKLRRPATACEVWCAVEAPDGLMPDASCLTGSWLLLPQDGKSEASSGAVDLAFAPLKFSFGQSLTPTRVCQVV